MLSFSKNFDFNLRRDHQNNFYERRDYEAVDEKLLTYLRLCPEKRRKKEFRMKRVNVKKYKYINA